MARPAQTQAGAQPHCSAEPSDGERLLLAALRAWAQARIAGDRPSEVVGLALASQASGRIRALFMAWIQSVEAGCRRTLQIDCPRCGGVSQDEQRLIMACGLARAAPELAEQILQPLLLDGRSAIALAAALNVAMTTEGWRLPARLTSSPSDHAPDRDAVPQLLVWKG